MSSSVSPLQPPNQPRRPHLTIASSLHPCTLSLSSPTLPTASFTLTLFIRLTNTTCPITVFTGDSFLSSLAQSFYQSDYRLRSLTTGTVCLANVTCKFRTGIIRIADPEADLLELRPGEAITREVRIGVAHQHQQNDGRTNARPPLPSSPSTTTTTTTKIDSSPSLADLAICATPLSDLTAGEEYQIQLAHSIPDEWPNHVWWWMEGEKAGIIRDAGKRGPQGLMKLKVQEKEAWAVKLMSGFRYMVRVEIGEGAVLKVVE